MRLTDEQDHYALMRAVVRWPVRWSRDTLLFALTVPRIFEVVDEYDLEEILDELAERLALIRSSR